MELSSKVLVSRGGALIRREDEVVIFYIRKMVVLNTKTGDIIFRPKFTESVDLNWASSNDAGDYIVKKSVSDGVLETGGYCHVITGRSSKITEVKGGLEKCNRNNNQLQKQTLGPTTNWSPIQTVLTAVQEDKSSEITRQEEVKAKEARRRQIEDFFTDPVDREMFPLNATETSTTRTIRPAEIPTAEESISTMLGKFSAALLDKDFMREVYEYRRLPRPPARGLAPLSYEWLTLNTYSGLMQSIEQQAPGDSQVNANIQQRLDTEIETIDDQGIKESDPCSSVDEEEQNEHQTSRFVRLFCCGATSRPKMIKDENQKKRKGFLSQIRKMFGRK
ncbi:uncharacterized protein LOC128182523 [Crassostrea angulata]|uniref:uncharacterized protein LOC128182523 n=1 Tax=Magallana angulata TaxID=2784310 RepID=UPI0022B0E647|nr:uncharacterized protein LOC128182523 [Crassostrea angulata]